MNDPARDTSTSESQVHVSWTGLSSPNNGGSAILSYNLEWNGGSGSTYTSLVGYSPASTALSLLITSSITAGTTYSFRLRAQNIFGWGPYSNIVSIVAATTPS